MTKKEYNQKLKDVLISMIDKEVNHFIYGKGKIVEISDYCYVKYDSMDSIKRLAIDSFFDYNEPIHAQFKARIDEIKFEYECSSKIETKKTSNNGIKFEDIVGLEDVKKEIKKLIINPFSYPFIYSRFNRTSGGGILLYGAPGTGKTMIAKAIANEIDATFIQLTCSDILSKYIGESEQKIKNIFDEARKQEKAIIYFDEFDSIGMNRNEMNETNYHNSQMVAELLSQIDGVASNNRNILIIASTNKPWHIDSALLRSGRFNKRIYVPLPKYQLREELFKKQLNNVPIEEINYQEIIKLTEGYSYADIVEICNIAKDYAIEKSIENKKITPISEQDLLIAIKETPKTVRDDDLNALEKF